MDAIILAAGKGERIKESHNDPKILLELGGITLLERHLKNLESYGVKNVHICCGYKYEKVIQKIKTSEKLNLSVVVNSDFDQGSLVSLWCMREIIETSSNLILMDADVLYHPSILNKLISDPHQNSMLFDAHFEAGEEPVKICLKEGKIKDFGKTIDYTENYDLVGESIGFFKFCKAGCAELYSVCEHFIDNGKHHYPHEEVIRKMVVSKKIAFTAINVTNEPWIEIDFPEDIEKAEREILPLI